MTERELDQAQVTEYADKIMEMIREGARNGVHSYTVRTFSKLHEDCDANMYLEDAGQDYDGSDFSMREINAVEDLVEARLMAGELSGGATVRVTWTVTEQHQKVTAVNRLRDLFEVPAGQLVAVEALTDDEAIGVLEEGGSTWHSDVGREVTHVEEIPDRALNVDEVAAVGLDCTGADGHPAYPYHWSALSDERRHVIQILGGSEDREAEAFTDRQVQVAQLNAAIRNGSKLPEDLLKPDMTFAEVKAVARGHDPDGVAAMVAHDARVGLPGFTRVVTPAVSARGSMAWAEQVMLGGTPQMQAVKQAAARRGGQTLAGITDDLGDSATTDAIVQGVAHAIMPRQPMLDLIVKVEAMRQLDSLHAVADKTGGGHGSADVKQAATGVAREVLDLALELLGITE